MVIERIELRMMPEPSGVAPGHAHHMRHSRDLGSQKSCDAVGLHVMRINDMEGSGGMRAGSERCELGDEGARHGDIGLRAVDRIGPVHAQRTFPERRLALLPIPRAHMHAERAPRLFRIGDDLDLMAAFGETMRGPIGSHAHAALNRGELADDANPQAETSMRPACVSSAISSSACGTASNTLGSVHSSSAVSTSNTSGASSVIFGCPAAAMIARLVSRRCGAIALCSKMDRTS